MNADKHVFNMNIGDARTPSAEMGFDRAGFDAVDMADVDGQVEQWMANSLVELGEALEGVDEHARLGFEGEPDVFGFRLGQDRANSFAQAIEGLLLVNVFPQNPRPKGNHRRVEPSGQVDRSAEKIDSHAAPRRIGVHQGGIVLFPRIQEKTRTGLDDSKQSAGVERLARRRDPAIERASVFVRIKARRRRA